MARKKKKIQSTEQDLEKSKKEAKEHILSKLDISESYVSLTIGILVVIFAFVLVVVVLKQSNVFRYHTPTQSISSDKIEEIDKKAKEMGQSYTVIEGDDLKTISRKIYGSVDYYEEIIKANNIQNPDLIEVGQVLKIPRATGKMQNFEKITGDNYTAKENETIWDIAVKAYGDGFRWPDITKANNFENPDMLTPGTLLKIPR